MIRAGWPRIAAEGGALAGPMCGVGTFRIEAALMAADVAPNLRREHWGFSAWLGHVPALWKRLHAEAQARAEAGLARPPLWIRGYEADPRLIQPARNNIERAGVGHWVKIYQGELATFEPRPDQNQTGLVICNPPYGERLGDEASLLYLYQHLGERLRQSCLNWRRRSSPLPDLGKRMGLRSHKQYAFWNGALACKLLLIKVLPEQFVTERRAAAASEGEPQVRNIGGQLVERPPAVRSASPRLSEGGQMSPTACRRTSRRWASGRRRPESSATGCTMPTCPSTPWRSIYTATGCTCRSTPRRARFDPDKAQARLLDALAAIPQALDIDPAQVVIKRRERQAGKKQYERQDQQGRFMEVGEGGVRLLVNLTDYLDTGLFLDHRPLRLRIQQEAAGKRFLNLFCYTATASVHAARGGAPAPPASICRRPTWTGHGATWR